MFGPGRGPTAKQNQIDSVEEALALAEQQQAAGDYAGAMATLSLARQLDPHSMEAVHRMACLKHHHLGDREGALELYNLLLSTNDGSTNNAIVLRERADLLQYQFGHLQAALADYNAAGALSQDDPELFANRGELYLKQLDYEHAFADFERCLALNPHHARAVLGHEECQTMLNKLEKERANQRIKQALANLPTIEFERNKHNLDASDVEMLNEVSRIMAEFPRVRLKVTGITVNPNKIPLANNRAQACIDYTPTPGALVKPNSRNFFFEEKSRLSNFFGGCFVKKGIDKNRMEPYGIHGDQMATAFDPVD
eukprot:NODE_1451_length_1158_cov_59.290352_g1193_i0.p1 GENE.NODE_1451_length_1158_cov_59.290352_g1193_i0~~NODE_1451_length_1158_cov_59.290352_g1193_i0.p1  ORF type:complete len:311 (+),score=69.06 NODE_1451_length_1158_cov_59.290352_g1193_i0:33-965(+)